MKVLDLTGMRFGKLVAVRKDGTYTPPSKSGSAAVWLCRCDCGAEKRILGNNLRRGLSRSCGCLRGQQIAERNATHRESKTQLHNTWCAIKQRCCCPTYPAWERYGGRGIKICAGFLDYETFRRVVGLRPTPLHTVDRIDNEKHYSCGQCDECRANGWDANVRWATRKEQSDNRSITIRLTHNGKTQTLVAWAAETGLPYDTIHRRYKAGWADSRILTTPRRKPPSQSCSSTSA